MTNRTKKKKPEYACCDEENQICDTCSFEDSIKITDDEINNE